MQSITRLKSIRMQPILAQDIRISADKLREKKGLAKLIEYCGIKAIGIGIVIIYDKSKLYAHKMK